MAARKTAGKHGPPEVRFFRHVDRTGSPSGCWLWTAATAGKTAVYGMFWNGQRNVKAHRWSYEHHVGPIPEGLEIDHVAARGCTSKLCVNPAHLEPVTHAENRLRSRLDVCRAGLHDLTVPENVRWNKQGHRTGCRACWKQRRAERAANRGGQ